MSLNRPHIKGRIGGMIHVEVPLPPHPLAAGCPTCMAHRGNPCSSKSKRCYPFSEREKGWTKNPHPARATWAKKMHVLDLLKKHGPCRAAELGAHLWPDKYRKPQHYARPAYNVLRVLEQERRVTRTMNKWGTYWEVVNW